MTMTQGNKMEFQKKTRLLFQLLRTQHHIGYVERSSGSQKTPQSLNRVKNWLQSGICPAKPNPHSLELLKGNADNWCHTTLQILEEHHNTTKRDLINSIKELPTNDWQEAWNVALRWIQKRFPHFKQATLQQTADLLTELGIRISPSPTSQINTNPNRKRQRQKQTQSPPTKRICQNVDNQTITLEQQSHHPQTSTIETGSTPQEDKKTSSNQTNMDENESIECMAFSVSTKGKIPIQPEKYKGLPDTNSNQTSSSKLGKEIPVATKLTHLESTEPLDTSDLVEEWLENFSLDSWVSEAAPHPNPKPQREHQSPQHTETRHDTKPTQERPKAGPSKETDFGEVFLPFLEDPELFTRHNHNGNKRANWSLRPQRPIIIMGDSNLAKLPLIHDDKVQVDCFPGANLTQATHLLRNKTATSNETQIVILSFGINNREQGNYSLLKHYINHLQKAAQDTFPFAKIYIPLINFSTDLEPNIRNNIRALNLIIRTTMNQHIPRLEYSKFETGKDNIHWTLNTGSAMWNHWKTFLGLQDPWTPGYQRSNQ